MDMTCWFDTTYKCSSAENTDHTQCQHALLSEAEDSQASRVARTQQVCELSCRQRKVRMHTVNSNWVAIKYLPAFTLNITFNVL